MRLFTYSSMFDASIYAGHLMENIESKNLLHRAFSVFLFNSKYELLLQVWITQYWNLNMGRNYICCKFTLRISLCYNLKMSLCIYSLSLKLGGLWKMIRVGICISSLASEQQNICLSPTVYSGLVRETIFLC